MRNGDTNANRNGHACELQSLLEKVVSISRAVAVLYYMELEFFLLHGIE